MISGSCCVSLSIEQIPNRITVVRTDDLKEPGYPDLWN